MRKMKASSSAKKARNIAFPGLSFTDVERASYAKKMPISRSAEATESEP